MFALLPNLAVPARRAVLALVAAVVLLGAGLAQDAHAAVFTGTVVHVDEEPRSDRYLVAGPDGELRAVHGSPRPVVGTYVRVEGVRLPNGTWAADEVDVRVEGHETRRRPMGRKWASRRSGSRRRYLGRKWAALRKGARRRHLGRKWAAVRTRRARVRGTVTFTDPARSTMTVSARGASLTISGGAASVARASSGLPRPGTMVRVEVAIDSDGGVVRQAVEDLGEDTDGIDLAGTVHAVYPESRMLYVSVGDDTSGVLTVYVPWWLDMAQYRVGDDYTMTVSGGEGTYLLLDSHGDDSLAEAADPDADQAATEEQIVEYFQSHGGRGGHDAGDDDGGHDHGHGPGVPGATTGAGTTGGGTGQGTTGSTGQATTGGTGGATTGSGHGSTGGSSGGSTGGSSGGSTGGSSGTTGGGSGSGTTGGGSGSTTGGSCQGAGNGNHNGQCNGSNGNNGNHGNGNNGNHNGHGNNGGPGSSTKPCSSGRRKTKPCRAAQRRARARARRGARGQRSSRSR